MRRIITIVLMLALLSVSASAMHPIHIGCPHSPGHEKHNCFPTPTVKPSPTVTTTPQPSVTATATPTITPPSVYIGLPHMTIEVPRQANYSILYQNGKPQKLVFGNATNQIIVNLSAWNWLIDWV